ncbi:(2Fe-2S)-binding protein [Thiosulfatihalobacter marinus]|jgi:carbon-monoxide dehydrogenase small subunit|uniref:(2Fe-2S)-binding protein n=1 Tax=Thiosulfatihalobacter marinus TaxID=2792481 RepID=UPI0018D99AB6|nr:(2Fe-2S)-binding protein [Thiosulfatihalobacter marinus]
MPKTPIRFTLNGAETGVFANSGANLLDVLRREAGDLTPKQGCAQGGCGACSVMIDGELHLACLTLAETAEGRRIDTVASLETGARLHPLQKAFAEGFAAQCGFCSPGMIMAAKALLDTTPNPTREQVAEAISGNLCRCTGYEPIINAILTAAAELRGRGAA